MQTMAVSSELDDEDTRVDMRAQRASLTVVDVDDTHSLSERECTARECIAWWPLGFWQRAGMHHGAISKQKYMYPNSGSVPHA